MPASFFSSLSSQLSAYRDAPLILIAYSGGVDSQFLLHHTAAWALDNNCLDRVLALYIHHGLSDNADGWAEHCKHSAEQLGVRFVMERVQLAKTGSIEQEARHARYQVFARYMDAAPASNCSPLLLTAHHQDDQVETFLLALKRGSGPTGLAGMAPSSAFAGGLLLRPMLDITRADIEACAQALALSWIEDESNTDTRYDRNFLRHEIIPQLKQRFAGWNKAVSRSAELCAKQDELLSELLAERLQEAMQDDTGLPHYLQSGLRLSALQGQSRSLQSALLRAWLQYINSSIGVKRAFPLPSRAQLDEIIDSVIPARSDANPQLSWHNVSVRRFRERLYLVPQCPDISQLMMDIRLDECIYLPEGAGQLELSSQFKAGALALRRPTSDERVRIGFSASGATLKPVARQGSRKLKKLYQEYQVPSWMRTRLPIVYYNEQIVAIAGLFVVEGLQAQTPDCVYLHYF